MAYDYSSESKTFELPNPYRFQNLILFICAACYLVAGLYSLVDVRAAMNIGQGQRAVAPLLFGLVLLGLGLYLASNALRRLRFYFGRGKPVSLAPELNAEVMGSSKAAEDIKETLRQRTLAYYEPKGTIQGLLYHQFPSLITAPQTVQNQAQQHFINLAAVGITLVSFLFAWGLLGDAATRPWVSLLYFVFGTFWLLKPVASNGRAQLNMMHLISLIVAGILAPVLVKLVGAKLPNMGELNFHLQTFTLLIGGLIALVCVFAAAISQITLMPTTSVSSELSRQSMQSPPSTLFDELSRVLQSKWTENIPNRRYSYTEPQTPLSEAGGTFTGELLEETQPMPIVGRQAQGFGQLWSDKSRRYLVVTDLFGALLMLVSVTLAILFIRQFDPFSSFKVQPWSMLSASFVLACVGLFCFRNSSVLWGRFDFQSELIWTQAQGAYQVAQIGTGNQFSSQMQTRNDMVRVEGMTLNIWRSSIESVVFGQGQGDEVRQIIAMRSNDTDNKVLHEHLQSFIANQSVLSAPGSSADASKMQRLLSSERLMEAASGLVQPALGLFKNNIQQTTANEPRPAAATAPAPASKPSFCSGCGAAVTSQAKFCSGCGQAVTP